LNDRIKYIDPNLTLFISGTDVMKKNLRPHDSLKLFFHRNLANGICLFIAAILFLATPESMAQEPGTIKQADQTINIRSSRSKTAKIIGKLRPGNRIKVNFLINNWYAVFSLNQSAANETQAMGYVFAPFLKPVSDTKNIAEKKTAPASRKQEKSGNPDKFVSIDFNNVDIRVFIKFISELTGKNFVVDQRVKGKITIISPSKISIPESYKVFESVLEIHGYSTVRAGKVIKIIPSPDARTKNISTLLKEEARSPEDKVVTQLIPLKYALPNEIKKLFAPLISKNSVILAYAPTNTLIVTDVYSNILRLLKILKNIDVEGIGQEISVIPLEFANASKLSKLLGAAFKTTVKPKKGVPLSSIKILSEERTNTIVLLASEDDTLKIKRLIKLLDKEMPRGEEKFHIYYLENATAEDLAKVLQALPSKQKANPKGKEASPVLSEKIKITADKATNSLIIMADKDDYMVLEEIIMKLDIPRAMVYIEALIMEVNTNKNFQLGTSWTALGKTDLDTKSSGFGAGFKGGMTDAGTLTNPTNFSLGVIGGAIDIMVNNTLVSLPSIGAVIQAFQTDADVNILSTPQILTTENEEATITVGENRPFQTKSAAENASETYSSYEYRDVGKTLKITPYISKDRMVRLKIDLLVSSAAEGQGDRPTTSKRTINTTVIVKDNNTVVIGGLIDDSYTDNRDKVPCLGDVPLVGALFRSTTQATVKTNLYIFLTPHVIQSPEESTKVFRMKKDHIDRVKEGKIKLYQKNRE